MTDFKWIEPGDDGRWRWPFAIMRIGDEFRVAPELRHIGSVRAGAYAAANRLSKRFSVTTESETGAALVRCVGAPAPLQRGTVEIKYQALHIRILRIYGDDCNTWPWGDPSLGNWVPGKRDGAFADVQVHVAFWTYRLRFEEDGISIELLADELKQEEALELLNS